MTKILNKLFKLFLYSFILATTIFAQGKSPADITITHDGIHLKGKFYVAEGMGPFTTVIILHGMPGNENDVLGVGNKLSQSGINALTFNYGGTHKSQGKMSLDNAQLDIHAAFNFLREPENISKYKIDTSLIYLGGWCFGGGMALAYAANHPEITTVFSIAGNDHGEFFREYIRNAEVKKMIDDMFAGMSAPSGPVRFEKGALPKEIAEGGIDKLNPAFDLRKSAPLLAKKGILIIGGWDDAQVTIDQFILPFYRALQHEKAKNVRLIAFQDDHYFRNTREEVARTIIDWIKNKSLN